jgi:hypothetical protein
MTLVITIVARRSERGVNEDNTTFALAGDQRARLHRAEKTSAGVTDMMGCVPRLKE